MHTTLNEYLHYFDSDLVNRAISDYLSDIDFFNQINCKIVCFEAHLSPELFSGVSIKPFMDGFVQMFEFPINVSHRYFDSEKGLGFFTKFPDGNLWFDNDVFGTPVFVFSFHGSPGKPETTLGKMTSEQLLSAFNGGFDSYPNLFFFSSCSLFGGKEGADLAKKLLSTTGTRAILGYTNTVRWDNGIITLLSFLAKFFNAKTPFEDLEEIYQDVIDEYIPALKANGFSLFLNPDFYPGK